MTAPIGFATDPRCLEHDPGPWHPESGARLRNLVHLVERRGLRERLVDVSPRECTDGEVLRVHTDSHLNRVLEVAGRVAELDPDTRTSEGSVDAARRALGSTLALVDAVLDDEVRAGFAAVRPPGHHATSTDAMGFCLFTNVAAAAAHALDRPGIDRVLVLDWDVHHGNGTAEIFRDDDRVALFSSHRFPFYPFSGGADEVHDGRTVNAPLPEGFGDADVAEAWHTVAAPVARRHAPDLILVSAGYDAHAADPIGGCAVTEEGFAALAGLVDGLARELCGGRWVAVLEGGYNLRATARSAVRTLEVMLDGPPAKPGAPGSEGTGGEPAAATALVKGILNRAQRSVARTEWGRGVEF